MNKRLIQKVQTTTTIARGLKFRAGLTSPFVPLRCNLNRQHVKLVGELGQRLRIVEITVKSVLHSNIATLLPDSLANELEWSRKTHGVKCGD